ncbi:MAG: hypothetical protein Q4C50_08220 [Eubacteriales bacterium]|nr:hypothetical protein [Eubacteriales bacterium]
MDNNQQYKWRQRKKRNTRITIWIILVILAAAGGTFAYEGMKESNPLNVAKKYFKDAVGAEEYTVETGDRSLNKQNQFVQNYTFTYTADGKEVRQSVNMVQQNEKKYGLFEQWAMEAAGASAVDMELIVPAGTQVLIDSRVPDQASIKEDEDLSPGAVCYQLSGVEPTAKLQINGLPFESYEGTLETSGTVLDVRNQMKVSDNAKVQMEEIAKTMINDLYTNVLNEEGEEALGDQFAQVPNKSNLYRAISENLFRDGQLQVNSISFEGFQAEFGDIYYPGKDEESFVGIEMKLSYTCNYERAAQETEAEQEEESETETENAADTSVQKEATFYFRYQDGNCVVTSAEVPGVL